MRRNCAHECAEACDCENLYEIIDRLGYIEDILGDDYDLGRLMELVQSDREGRCVVLPCKVGTPVYIIQCHIGCAAMDDESYKFIDNFTTPFRIDMLSEFGKTVFPSREAAEAALKGEQDG